MPDLAQLQKHLGINFNNASLLQQAFLHASYINENPDYDINDNERLEFLGDAIINFVTAEALYHRFPELPEGKLTELRVALIRKETLADLAQKLNLGDYLQISKGEEASGGKRKPSNLADTLEALIGAIFLDQGIEVAKKFALAQLEPHFIENRIEEISINYKGKLQEYVQSVYKKLPVYRLVGTSGPDHDKTFTAEVSLDDKVLGTGSGKSKQLAEMDAAHNACLELKI